jgi:hypothetical protein
LVLKLWKIGGQKGRPADQVAHLVGAYALIIYEEAAGRIGSRSVNRISGKVEGPFFSFLQEVFEIIGIKASPDASNMSLQAELKKLRGK